MKIPLLTFLVNLIEEVLKADAPAVGKAAGQAAAQAAIASAESDPKVQAITTASAGLLTAAQNLKTVLNEHPDAPTVTPPPNVPVS